ncbi:MAG: flagellar hook protein FlgE [Acidobacteriota bacterium]|nr:flagellar hook protein FlgE [Acidobacteriota bacterium]
MGFSTSLSGLYANQQKLNVIGNNLANLNTIGFKASSVQFMDLVSQSVGGSSLNPMQVGLGVTTGSISPNFRQGGIESTGIATNVAIQGSGFFVVGDSNNRSYTRAGDFSFDADGMLVTPDGQPVQGYTAIDPVTGDVITTGQPGNVIISPGVLRPPSATTLFGTTTNLDAGAAVGDTFTASVQLYDSLGEPHVATITYTRTGPGAWGYDISVPGDDVTGGTAGTPFSIGAGTMAFDATGRLAQVNGAAAADLVITAPAWANGAAATNFTWDLVDANGVATVTGFGSPSATSSITQNGMPAGTITALGINAAGEILATFGSGAAIVVGQLAVANFNNPQGLTKIGSNRFSETESSGIANVGIAGTGGRGTLTGGAVEQSNVDIAQEFTQMILAQRGYQANSKSITVADELLLETLNLKR